MAGIWFRGCKMDFTISAKTETLRAKVRTFIDEEVLPVEEDRKNWDEHENIADGPLQILRDRAKALGIWAPQAPIERGGLGLSTVERAVFYEEANRSLFGPVCLNCAAPDDGNISVLAKIGTPEQQDRWLQPIIDGEVRSAFAMTEPAPGGGSDPSMIQTTATRHSDAYVVTGRKWFITGAEEAKHFILLARTSDDPVSYTHLTLPTTPYV